MADTRSACTVISSRARLVVSVSDFRFRGPGSIIGCALTTFCFLFSPCNAILLHTSNRFEGNRMHS